MRLYDMHADTPYRIFSLDTDFSDSRLHISCDKLKSFSDYRQFFAIWSDYDKDNEEAYNDFFLIRKRFIENTDKFNFKNMKYCFSVEDARLLNRKAERISTLYEYGVRILTLVWRGNSVIGGAYDTQNGLTDFGKEVVLSCFKLGIVPDVSHASVRTIQEVNLISHKIKKPYIATHSNSYNVHPHKRNLTDSDFLNIMSVGGIVGVCLAPTHLCAEEAHITDVIRHIEHYLSIGGENTVCLGCDFDGIDETPIGISDISMMYTLKNELIRLRYNELLIDKIFYKNANDFVEKNINLPI